MTHATLSAKERLQQLEHEIAQCEPLANAGRAFSAAKPQERNPWKGQTEKLAILKTARQDAALLVRGEELSALLSKRAELTARCDRLSIQRKVAERVVAERAQHPTVVRYKRAPSLFMREETPWGHSFEIFKRWYETNLPLRPYGPECAPFFLHGAEARAAGVSFDLQNDR